MSWPPENSSRKSVAPSCATASSKTASQVSNKIAMNDCLRLKLSADTLLRLLASGQFCAADFRRLDCESKHCLWRLLLMSCAKTINLGTACNGCCAECGSSKHGKFKKRTDMSVLLRTKSLSPASNHDPSTKQSLTCKN